MPKHASGREIREENVCTGAKIRVAYIKARRPPQDPLPCEDYEGQRGLLLEDVLL